MKRKTVPAVAVLFVILMVCIKTNFVMAQSELSLKVDELADKLTSSMSGQVIGVKGDSIYIDLGEKDSVLQGSEFEVVRLGEVMMVGEKAYHQEDYVADIEVTRVRKDMSIARMASKTAAQIKKGDKVYQKSRKVKRIAIVEFPHEGRFNNFTLNVYESLSVFFVQKGYQVVERSQLDKVLDELKTSHSGLIDVSTMKKLGKMVGAEAILLGSVADFGNELAIRARLIDVEKGVAISASQVGVTITPLIMEMIEQLSSPQIAAVAVSKKTVPLSKNLLINPGAEDGLEGWKLNTGTYKARSKKPPPYEGDWYFFPGAHKGTAIASQKIDLEKITSSRSRTKQYCIIKGFMRDHEGSKYKNGDISQIVVDFLDKDRSIIKTIKSKQVAISDYWVEYYKKIILPEGTVRVNFKLVSIYRRGHTMNNGYFDDLYFGISKN